ncbi:MAG: hypothetical protein VX899_25935 [Myxococcota bacterium]|nr:hypothetical protein [Myxococcota bacterium]
MTQFTRLAVALALVGGLAFAGQAQAQELDASGNLEQSTTASPKEMVSFATEAVEEMRTAQSEVQRMLADAEKAGDVYQVQCLNKKLSAIAALAEVSESAKASMQEALASGDVEGAQIEFRRVAVGQSKTRQFRAEAEACTRDDGTAPGDVSVDVSNEALADSSGDTESIDDGNIGVGSEPPSTSPFE